jgi:hypothetical protein
VCIKSAGARAEPSSKIVELLEKLVALAEDTGRKVDRLHDVELRNAAELEAAEAARRKREQKEASEERERKEISRAREQKAAQKAKEERDKTSETAERRFKFDA